ncbi:myosin-binding protein 2 [Tripterygium wilfordii]|uniref:Myosin-binding protein 2 n=1 Tax=Tripterygium wilfordii TaxID=458696 RepID=A0A7J7DNW7_TRIWF|nr:myosin-binding protein 2 [Tripterygium wilfordii]KAF5748031.1 myosin-binding protein 2 [Tripterygium wilfordii]
MAANRFATIMHRNCNKITLVLVYAILEWILIALLLLNSLFSYLLIKFADYFGLKRPCIWCSRIDHVFDPKKGKCSYRDLVCESHASEISKLGFCSRHGKLAESLDLCEDCSSSVENGEMSTRCSCCGGDLDTNFYLGKLSWRVLDYTHKGNLISEGADDDKDDEGECPDLPNHEQGIGEIQIGKRQVEVEENSSCSVSNSDCKEVVTSEEIKEDLIFEKEQDRLKEDDSNLFMHDQSRDHPITEVGNAPAETLPQHLEFFIDQDDCHLIPVDDLIIVENPTPRTKKEEKGICSDEDLIFEFGKHFESQLEEKEPILSGHGSEEKPKDAVFESIEFGEYVSSPVLVFQGDLSKEECEQITTIQAPSVDENDVQESTERAVEEMGLDASLESDEAIQMQNDEIEVEVSIGTDIPDQELIDDIQCQEDPAPTSNAEFSGDDECRSKRAEEDLVEFKTITVQTRELVMNNHLSFSSELDENIEEDNIPDTPSSVDNLHHLHRKLLVLERRNSGMEDSLDGGSVLSDIEGGGDGVLTTEKLKSALKAERKALNALFAELEEERSASAVAASQTMAMINRLQEEKAAMQMEALQYQRMMEEQSEYDQEALQLLNDLIVKREKEKAELEKELETYRKKIQLYEEKERILLSGRKKGFSPRSVTTSASCSNAEDSDGLSIDFNHETKEEDNLDNHQEIGNQNTPPDEALYLEESLANFEEERLSILEELKVLEEKLFTLDGDSDEDEQHFEDIKPVEHLSHKENGNGYIEHIDYSNEVNGVIANGHSKETNGKHHQERRIKAKRLLPLFDATDDAISEEDQSNGYTEGNKKPALEEEVDHVYERLQALEADREFLKHCITSLSKGDKGVYLLQEILQHLRDLRSVEVRVKNMENGALH